LVDLALDRSEGEAAYTAWRISEGDAAYLDPITRQPPGVLLVHRLAQSLAGDERGSDRRTLRLLATLAVSGSTFAVFLLAQAWLPRRSAVLAALAFGLLASEPAIHGPLAHAEHFALSAVLLASVCWLGGIAQGASPRRNALVAGLLLGAAATVFPAAAINAPFLVWVALVSGAEDRRLPAPLSGAAWLTAGFAISIGGVAGWLASMGALHGFLASLALPSLPSPDPIDLSAVAGSQGIAWLLGGVGLLGVARSYRDGSTPGRLPAVFLLGYVACNALVLAVAGRNAPQSVLPLLPAIAIGVGCLLADLSWWRDIEPRARALFVGTVVLLPLYLSNFAIWSLTSERAMRRMYPRQGYELMPRIGRTIASRTAPNETVLVFGAAPELLYEARRRSASRHLDSAPLFASQIDARERQSELVAHLEANPASAIVWAPLTLGIPTDLPPDFGLWLAARIRAEFKIHSRILIEPGMAPRYQWVPVRDEARDRALARPSRLDLYLPAPIPRALPPVPPDDGVPSAQPNAQSNVQPNAQPNNQPRVQPDGSTRAR
jgi:MFS family permease